MFLDLIEEVDVIIDKTVRDIIIHLQCVCVSFEINVSILFSGDHNTG